MHTGNPGTWAVLAEGSEGFKVSLSYRFFSSKQTKLKSKQTKYLPTDSGKMSCSFPIDISSLLSNKKQGYACDPRTWEAR